MSIATLTSIDTNLFSQVQASAASIQSILATAGNAEILYSESQQLVLASETLDIISQENILATATNSITIASATQEINNASEIISSIVNENLYGFKLNMGGNVFFTVIMGISMILHSVLCLYSKFWWFGISIVCGNILEFLGYLGRSLAVNEPNNFDFFLLQIICLTIAPAFIMAGIYYLLGQMCVIYGTNFSILKPLWYSYIFIACDVASLVIQAAGGGIAGVALDDFESTTTGTHIMVAGIAFQVFTMSLFLVFWFNLLVNVYDIKGSEIYKPSSIGKLFRCLFNYKNEDLLSEMELQYNKKYEHIREKGLFKWFPLIITCSVLFIFVRCIYRVVELSEGWSGFLITHEAYIFVLDASMVFLTLFIYVPFHPVRILGKDEKIGVKEFKSSESIGDNIDQAPQEGVQKPDNSNCDGDDTLGSLPQVGSYEKIDLHLTNE